MVSICFTVKESPVLFHNCYQERGHCPLASGHVNRFCRNISFTFLPHVTVLCVVCCVSCNVEKYISSGACLLPCDPLICGVYKVFFLLPFCSMLTPSYLFYPKTKAPLL